MLVPQHKADQPFKGSSVYPILQSFRYELYDLAYKLKKTHEYVQETEKDSCEIKPDANSLIDQSF